MESSIEASNASQVPASIEQDAPNFNFEARQQRLVDTCNDTSVGNRMALGDQTMESLALKLDSEKSSGESSLDLTTRIPYDNGYGDLCFGRLIDRYKVTSFIGTTDNYWREGSNGIPVPELDSSQTFGPFPFFKLPRDIRDKIDRLLLGPLYTFNPKTKSSYIEMYLKDDSHKFERLTPYDGTFDDYLKRQQTWGGIGSANDMYKGNAEDETKSKPHSDVVLSTEQYEAMKRQFYKDKEKQIQSRKTQPSRGSPYRLEIIALRNNAKNWVNNQYYLLMEWIRQASNVCTEFRAELANIIWSNVRIDADGGDEDMWHLAQLIYERPAASLGIRSISIKLDMMYSSHLNWDSAEFGAWCSELSQILEVEYFVLYITISVEILPSLGEFRGKFSELAAARNLRVTKKFNVALCFIDVSDDSDDSDSSRNRERRSRLLKQKYEPIIADFMLPDTLRKSATEQEIYLESRPTEQSSAPVKEPESD